MFELVENVCLYCGKLLKAKKIEEGAVFCNAACEQREARRVFVLRNAALAERPTKVAIGNVAEAQVIKDLEMRCFHVFRSVRSSAPCDIIALKGVQTLRIEVKTAVRVESGKITQAGPWNPRASDVRAFVLADGDIVYDPTPESLILQFDDEIRRCGRCGRDITNDHKVAKQWYKGELIQRLCASCCA